MDMPATITADDLLSEHRPYLLRFARQRLRDSALVEDLVQDTLLAALQGIDRFGGKSSVRTWLTGILINKIADSLRRDQRAPLLADATDNADHGEDGDAGERSGREPIEWRDPERLLEGRQFVELLGQRLQALSPRAAAAFELREIDGRGLDEIASALGISERHAAVLLHRTRTRLRDGLEQGGFAMRGAVGAG